MIAVGMPPTEPDGVSLNFVDGIVVRGILALALYCSVQLVASALLGLLRCQACRRLHPAFHPRARAKG